MGTDEGGVTRRAVGPSRPPDAVVSGARLADGTVLAERYEVRRYLGAGGMGTVYAAFDRQSARTVALKTLKRSDADSLYRFKAEFRALADVVHPNLVRLYELNGDGPLWFFTMELIHGASFAEWVRSDAPATSWPTRAAEVVEVTESTKPTNPAEQAQGRSELQDGSGRRVVGAVDAGRICDAARQLALGVDAIHEAGKLHRDLKPSNVLVTDEGRVVVLDFGLVIDRIADPSEETIDPSGAGTPAYMSPEQCGGAPATAASDWYAFGVMLYRGLAGRLPFRGRLREIFLSKQQDDAPVLSEAVQQALPALASLSMALLRRDPADRPDAQSVLASLGADMGARRPTIRPDAVARLVGRDAELQSILRLVSDARVRAAMVLITGPSGIGKSALVGEVCRQQEASGALCLRGRCYEREAVPFKAFDGVVDALSHHLGKLAPSALSALLPEGTIELTRLFPVMARIPGVALATETAPHAHPEEQRRRGFAALAELLAGLCRVRPVVVVLDDLQWADADSLALLEALVCTHAPACLLMATLRDDEGRHAARELDGVLGRADERLTIARTYMGPLSSQAIRAIVLEELGDAPASGLIHAAVEDARGNPFLAKELASYLRRLDEDDEDIPSTRPSIASLIAERLRRLEPAMRAALEVLSVAGKPMPIRILASAAGLDGDGEIAELVADKWVREDPASTMVQPIHDRIREEVAAQLGQERERAHRKRLVAVLLAQDPTDHEAVARHLDILGEAAQACEHAERAADAAVRKLAFSEGARLYELALTARGSTQDRALQCKLAEAMSHAGRGAEAAKWYALAASLAPHAKALQLRARAAEQLLVAGHVDEGFDELASVLAAMGVRAPVRNLAALADLAAMRLKLKLRGTDFREQNPSEVPKQTLAKIDLCRVGAQTFAAIAPVVGAALQTRHVLLALDSGHAEYAALGMAAAAGYRAYEGGRAREQSRRFLRLAEQLGGADPSPRVAAYLAFIHGVSHHQLGQYADATEQLRYAEHTFASRCDNVFGELSLTRTVLGVDLFLSGQLRAMTHCYVAWLADARRRDDRLVLTTQFAGGGAINLWLVRDEPEEARSQVHDAIRSWPSRKIHSDRYWHKFSLALIALYAGDDDALTEHARAFTGAEYRLFVSRLQARRVWARYVVLLSDLAAMHRAPLTRLRLRRRALKSIRQIRDERYGLAEALADTSEAWLRHMHGNDDEALRLLRRAQRVHEVCRNQLYCHSVRMQMGRLIGGDEGAELVRAASQALAAEGAVNPRAIARGQVPGFCER